MTAKPLEEWDFLDWNQALFSHFFDANKNDAPVTRLRVTSRVLAEAVGKEKTQAGEVEKCFRKIVVGSPTQINRRFSRNGVIFEDSFEKPPQAVLYLLFTCYVASGSDEVRNEGDFRRRMAAILQHPVGTSYPLDGLGEMWKELSRWIARARQANYSWRELVLPEPGHMVRIGYTLRLAFPNRSDYRLLCQIVSRWNLDVDSSLPKILTILNPERHRFSEAFRAVYEEFRQSIIAGTEDCEYSPIIDALQDAIKHCECHSLVSTLRPKFHLIAEEDDRGFLRLLLLCDRLVNSSINSRIGLFQPDRGSSQFPYAITFGSLDLNGADLIIEFMLAGELAEHMSCFTNTQLERIVREGVLLLHRASSGILECVSCWNAGDEMRPLVNKKIVPYFQNALEQAGLRDLRPLRSVYDDWVEFPPINASFVDLSSFGDLAGIGCLQRRVSSSRITLMGGIPTGESETWFGHMSILPKVRVSGGANSVLLKDTKLSIMAQGEAIKEVPGTFALRSLVDCPSFEGEHLVIAHDAQERTLQKRICFRTYADGFNYLGPSRPEQWLCESSFSDMVRWDPDAVLAGLESIRSNIPMSRLGESTPGQYNEEIWTRIEVLIETCATRCCRRRDFSEFEWIELFQRIVGIDDKSLARLALRAWIEAGYFDQAIDETWRTRRLFARRPRIALVQNARITQGRILGLAPALLINQLCRKVVERGGRLTRGCSVSPWVPPPWKIEDIDLSVLEEIVIGLSMAKTIFIRQARNLYALPQKVEWQLTELPMNYKLSQTWNWSANRFVDLDQLGQTEQSVVRVECWQRLQRLDRPDFFYVSAAETTYSTYSRNWALMSAAALAGVTPFLKKGTTLESVDFPWVFLPLGVGRYCFAAGAGAAGPVRNDNGELRYVYPLGNEKVADSILAAFRHKGYAEFVSTPPWLEALAARRAGTEALAPVMVGATPLRRVPISLRPLYIAHERKR